MTLGAPVLLSGDKLRMLSRVGTANEYQECLLQEVIDQQPSILPISDFFPGATNIFSLGREIPVHIGAGDGFIDNVLVTDDGHLVIVETKLWRNPQATREVIAQTLQYGMAVSQLSPLDFEQHLRGGDPRGRRLGSEETVAQHVQNVATSESMPALDDDFEDTVDRLRRTGEILLLIVSDCVRSSVERMIHWMNNTVGSAPYRLGLVEFCLYELPEVGRVVFPQTLLRIREGSRHVVTINVQYGNYVMATVSGPDELPKKQPVALPGNPISDQALTDLIRAKNSPEIVNIAEQLRTRLTLAGFASQYVVSEILYGIQVEGDFIPLVHLSSRMVYFSIPMRAVRALGDERFVDCKRRINKIAEFYRPIDVDDPTKTNNLFPKYGALTDSVETFVQTVMEIAEIVRGALEETT